MSRLIKTEASEMPREPPDRPSSSNYQEQINRLVEAVNRNTKEMQDLRMLIQTIGKNQELETSSLQMKCNGIQAQGDNMMRMICNGGVPLHGFSMNLNVRQYPVTGVAINQQSTVFDCVEPIEQPRTNVRNNDQKPSSSSQQSPAELDRSSTADAQILGQIVKRPWERVPVKKDPVVISFDETIFSDPIPKKKRKKVTKKSTFSTQNQVSPISEPNQETRRKKMKKNIILAASTHDAIETEQADNSTPRVLLNPARKAPAESRAIEEESKCIFCNISDHSTINCTEYESPLERMAEAVRRRLCLKCVKPVKGNKNWQCHLNCPKLAKKCQFCHSPLHNSIFCAKLQKDIKSGRFCEFCKDQSHDSKSCRKYFIGKTAGKRRRRMESERKCLKCFQFYGSKKEAKKHKCPNKDLFCALCYPRHKSKKKAAHHSLICDYFPNKRSVKSLKKARKRLRKKTNQKPFRKHSASSPVAVWGIMPKRNPLRSTRTDRHALLART